MPRNDGIAQNAHARSQPSAIFTYAHGAVGAGPRQLEQVAHAGRLALEHDLGERALAREPDDGVGLGQRGRELVAVALGHAAGDDELGAGPLDVGERERDVDRLLARGFDERARVDDDEVGVARRRRRREPVGEQGRDDLVGVDGVLRAAERLDVEPLRHGPIIVVRPRTDPIVPHQLVALRRIARWPTVRRCGARRAAPSTGPGSVAVRRLPRRTRRRTDRRVCTASRDRDQAIGDDDALVELGEWPKLQAQILRRRLETAGVPVMIEWSGTTTDPTGILVVPEDHGDFGWAVVNEIDVDDEVPDTSPHAYVSRIEEHLSAAAGLLDELRTRLDELEADGR